MSRQRADSPKCTLRLMEDAKVSQQGRAVVVDFFSGQAGEWPSLGRLPRLANQGTSASPEILSSAWGGGFVVKLLIAGEK
jgi:hypothetical protein